MSYQRSLALEESCTQSKAFLRDGRIVGGEALPWGFAVLQRNIGLTTHSTLLYLI